MNEDFKAELESCLKAMSELLSWKPLPMPDDPDWEKIKSKGSEHYKGTNVEVIDLLKGVTMHPSVTALQAKGLNDIIKYAYRMITKGPNESDIYKIGHYLEMVDYELHNNKEVIALENPDKKYDTNSKWKGTTIMAT
jgi:hypothetical protein